MGKREDLTTEWIRKKFVSNFDLCSFGINISRNLAASGNWNGTVNDVLDIIDKKADQEHKQNALKDVIID